MTSALLQNNLTVPEGCLVLETSGFLPWDNPDNIISQATEKAVDSAFGGICLPVLFVISVPSNVLNMLVFWKQGLKERINLCLFYLSLVDLLHILNSFMTNVDRLIPPFTQTLGPVSKFIITHKLTGLQGFYWLSGFISMLIACERCLCVVSPLRSHIVLKARTTTAILMMGTVFIMTLSMVVSLGWSLACMFDPATNTTSTVIYTGEFYAQNKTYVDLLTLILITVQPFTYVTVVLATTIVTTVKLKTMVAWREQTSSCALSSREVALTRTLIAVSALFMVCSVPTILIGIGVMSVPGFSLSGKFSNLVKVSANLMRLASYVNSTINFLIYCFLGSRFRLTLFEVLRRTLMVRHQQPNK